jgi:hypothetical protein
MPALPRPLTELHTQFCSLLPSSHNKSAVVPITAVTQTTVLSPWTVTSESCTAPERGNTFQGCGSVA